MQMSPQEKALESEAVRRGIEDTEVAFIDETNRSYAWYMWQFSEIQHRNPYLYNKLHVELYRQVQAKHPGVLSSKAVDQLISENENNVLPFRSASV